MSVASGLGCEYKDMGVAFRKGGHKDMGLPLENGVLLF